MSEMSNKWDSQWNKLLTHCYGEVAADEAFKAGLLRKLKEKTAENRAIDASPEAREDENWSRLLTAAYTPCAPSHEFKTGLLGKLKAKQAETVTEEVESVSGEDHNWRRLLTAAYEPCVPNPEFKKHLLGQLKARNTQLTGPVRTQAEDELLKTILTTSYTPVSPRREFQTRLLENLKERQRNTSIQRRQSRRRTLFLSAVSGLAAAAAVVFVVTVMRVDAPPAPTAGFIDIAQLPDTVIEHVPAAPSRSDFVATLASDTVSSDGFQTATANLAFAPGTTPYRVDEAFSGPALPETVHGVGMEVDWGEGWHPMGTNQIASLTPGMTFRPSPQASFATGLGFGDGSTILLCPDSVIEATDDGFTVRRGTLAVTVPENSDDRFRLHFSERDIAVEPGTMLAVTVPSPDAFAEGGAPAPTVRVADGGLAVARGKAGSGPLLANHTYRIDSYVTPDLPGRPICEAECAELEKRLNPTNYAALASTGNPSSTVGSVRRNTFSTQTAIPAGFVQRGSRWVSKNFDDQQTVKIKYLSDEYFTFANVRRDLAPALALGAEVVIDGGDGAFYEIMK